MMASPWPSKRACRTTVALFWLPGGRPLPSLFPGSNGFPRVFSRLFDAIAAILTSLPEPDSCRTRPPYPPFRRKRSPPSRLPNGSTGRLGGGVSGQARRQVGERLRLQEFFHETLFSDTARCRSSLPQLSSDVAAFCPPRFRSAFLTTLPPRSRCPSTRACPGSQATVAQSIEIVGTEVKEPKGLNRRPSTLIRLPAE